MVVGGRALEEEEEGAEELAPQAGNFAFYHTKASEYPRAPQPWCRASSVLEVGGCRGAWAPAGEGGRLRGARRTPLPPAAALILGFYALGPGESGPAQSAQCGKAATGPGGRDGWQLLPLGTLALCA